MNGSAFGTGFSIGIVSGRPVASTPPRDQPTLLADADGALLLDADGALAAEAA